MLICMRCGEKKNAHWFPELITTWCCWCNRCERTPSGMMPLPQCEQDRIVEK
ncbi:MAG: protein NinD [Aeromonadaceae bacterium]